MKNQLLAAALGATAIGGITYASQTLASVPTTRVGHGAAFSNFEAFLTGAKAKFVALDPNSDGAPSPEGHVLGHGGSAMGTTIGDPPAAQDPTTPPTQVGRGIERLDTDRDGKISRAEFDVQTMRRFQRMDANGDGTIDATELAAAPGRGAARTGADAGASLTKAEFEARATRRFQRMDANGDGFIDESERSAMRQRPDRRHRDDQASPAAIPRTKP